QDLIEKQPKRNPGCIDAVTELNATLLDRPLEHLLVQALAEDKIPRFDLLADNSHLTSKRTFATIHPRGLLCLVAVFPRQQKYTRRPLFLRQARFRKALTAIRVTFGARGGAASEASG